MSAFTEGLEKAGDTLRYGPGLLFSEPCRLGSGGMIGVERSTSRVPSIRGFPFFAGVKSE